MNSQEWIEAASKERAALDASDCKTVDEANAFLRARGVFTKLYDCGTIMLGADEFNARRKAYRRA